MFYVKSYICLQIKLVTTDVTIPMKEGSNIIIYFVMVRKYKEYYLLYNLKMLRLN